MVYTFYTTQTFASIIQTYKSMRARNFFSYIHLCVYLPLLFDARKTFARIFFYFPQKPYKKKRENEKCDRDEKR